MNFPLTRSRPLFAAETSTGVADRQAAAPPPAQLGRLLLKHLWLILTCFVAVTAVAMLALWWLPPAYVTNAKVLVKLDEIPNPAFFAGITPSRDQATEQPANRQIENEMELAETWPVAAAAVRDLNLRYDDVYQAPLTWFLRPAADLWDWVAVRFLHRAADPERRGFADTVALFSRSYSVGAVTSKSSDTNSNLISFTLQGTDPERARRSLEAVLDAYLGAAAGLRKDAAEKARAAVVSHVEAARSRVTEAQARLDAFLADPSGSGDAKATRDHAQAVELDRVVRLRQQELLDVEHRLSQIEMYLDLSAHDIDNRVVVEPPLTPRSSEWKRRALVGAVASLGGLFLGVFLAGLREMFDHRLTDAAAVKAYLDLPVIGALPQLKARERVAALDGQDLMRRVGPQG
jgi:uncharacterized protein involved in exopolysaccharide biosynthesis